MTDHKFEPFQKVLVRDYDHDYWLATFYSHIREDALRKYVSANGCPWIQCIPYTDETAHLIGTTQPYEPPVQYAFGQRVEVLIGKDWETAVFLLLDTNDERVPYSVYGIKSGQRWVTAKMIRPLST